MAFGVIVPVTIAAGFQNVTAVGQAIERRSGKPFAAEDLGPVLERQIGRDDRAEPLVDHGDDIEQQFRVGFGSRDITEFIKDKQIHS